MKKVLGGFHIETFWEILPASGKMRNTKSLCKSALEIWYQSYKTCRVERNYRWEKISRYNKSRAVINRNLKCSWQQILSETSDWIYRDGFCKTGVKTWKSYGFMIKGNGRFSNFQSLAAARACRAPINFRFCRTAINGVWSPPLAKRSKRSVAPDVVLEATNRNRAAICFQRRFEKVSGRQWTRLNQELSLQWLTGRSLRFLRKKQKQKKGTEKDCF